jgi:hypothetical protein
MIKKMRFFVGQNALRNSDLTKIFNRVQVLGFFERFGFRYSRYCGESAKRVVAREVLIPLKTKPKNHEHR